MSLLPPDSKDQLAWRNTNRMPLTSRAVPHDECSFGEFVSIHTTHITQGELFYKLLMNTRQFLLFSLYETNTHVFVCELLQ